MNRKILLGVVLAMVSVSMTPMLIGVGSAQQGTTTYTFEECEEGWTAASDSLNPISTGWTRAAPGDESEFAWHLESAVGGSEDEYLVSPVHTSDGTDVTLSYSLAHAIYDDETLERIDVEWSTDGAEWTAIEGKSYTATNEGHPAYIEDSATITPPEGNLQVRFHFFAQGPDPLAGGSTASVDNVVIDLPRPADATCDEPSASPSGSAEPSGSPSGTPSGSPAPSGSPSPSPSPTDPPDDDCTIRGDSGNNTLKGTSGDDIICGYGGDDTINGRGGNDIIRGGGGDDDIKGGPGNDKLKGGKGKDRLRGGKGSDSHVGGAGKDTCQDDQGNNKFRSCEKRK